MSASNQLCRRRRKRRPLSAVWRRLLAASKLNGQRVRTAQVVRHFKAKFGAALGVGPALGDIKAKFGAALGRPALA